MNPKSKVEQYGTQQTLPNAKTKRSKNKKPSVGGLPNAADITKAHNQSKVEITVNVNAINTQKLG